MLITWQELTSHFEPGQQRCWDVTMGHCSHPPPALPMPSHICTPSTLPFSFPKETGNPGAGICAPAWLPSWLRGHHRPLLLLQKPLCAISSRDRQTSEERRWKIIFFVRQEQQRELQRALGLAWRGRRTQDVPAMSSTTLETQAARSSQDHNKVQEPGRGLDGALHNPIFNY